MNESVPEIIDVEFEPFELPGDRRAGAVRDFLIRFWNGGIAALVALILWLAEKRKARAKRKHLMRVISPMTRCRACGWTGERHLFSGVWQTAVEIKFVEIQPTGNDPSTGAIKLTCTRCQAFWHVPTVQPAKDWVPPKPIQRNPMVR